MNKRLTIVVATLLLGMAQSASACMFDTDCDVGSKCAKNSGQLYGICVGGLNPGNSNDRTPVYDPLDPNGTVGDTCQFDVDCGPGNKCFKKPGGLYGACVRR